MKPQTKLRLRSEKGSVQGENPAGINHDSSFSNDERGSLDRSMSVQGLPLESSGIGMPSHPVMQPIFMVTPMHFGNGQPLFVPCQYGMAGSRGYPIQPVSLNQFKTLECGIKVNHDHKQCPHYHSMKDRRRPQTNKYDSELCTNTLVEKVCPKYESCTFSHNTVEQFYHPKKYKSKLCVSLGKDGEGKCVYGNFCSFAHNVSELKIIKLHTMEKTLDFFKYLYKTVYCPYNQNHDKSTCDYAHNVQDFRRDPRVTNYKPEACKKWSPSTDISKYEDGGCNYNEACDKCHGWKELEYHPKYYKTKPCSNGEKCIRIDCGYIHPNEKSRKEEDHREDSKHLQSFKDSKTSTSNKARGMLTESASQHSISNKDKMLTFNSSSNSKPAKNDSVLGRNDEDDKIDLHSIIDTEKRPRQHAYSVLGYMDDEDSVDDFTQVKNWRKSSVETVIGGTEDRFWLRSDSSSKIDHSRSFLSPWKLMRDYGPKSPVDSKTRPASPCLSASVLTLCSQPDEEPPLDSTMAHKLLDKFDLEDTQLLKFDVSYINELPGVTENEADILRQWRDVLLEQKREESILHMIDDFQDKCFKKV